MTPAEAVTGKTMREDLVQATVQPAGSDSAVTDAVVQLMFRAEPEAARRMRDACAHIANNYGLRILEHVSNFDGTMTAPLSQRQNETDSLRLERDALLAALESIVEYWNGGSESAVDAAEEMRFRAQNAIAALTAASETGKQT
jgi:hypothetical protein